MKLWKHHAAQPQADRINALAAERAESWLPRYGGLISSEWEFAKALQLLEEDPELYHRMDHWVEAADWIVWQLTGSYVRNACSAGYKGIYQDGRYPDADFLAALNPDFADFAERKLAHRIGQLGEPAGTLSAQAAAWTGLPEGIAVAVGNVDAHVTAPAARAVEPGQMLAIMGTSTCHVMNAEALTEVPGMCGVVDGGIVRGLYGYEAGQSGVGDIFGWFAENFVPDGYRQQAASVRAVGPGAPDRAGRDPAGRRARPARARLGVGQPVRPGRSHPVRPDRRHDAGHPAGGRLPGADRGDRVRHQEDRGDLRRQRRPGDRVRRGRRPAAERVPHADVRRRAADAGAHDAPAPRRPRSARPSTPRSRPAPTPTCGRPGP